MAETTKTSSGVQDLIARIRDEGVRSGQTEAERIVNDAKAEAARLLAEAREESERMRRKADEDSKAYKAAALEALRMAARDTGLELRQQVVHSFETHVKRLVTRTTLDGSILRDIILVLAGDTAEKYLKDKDVSIIVARSILEEDSTEPKAQERMHSAALAISHDMLREGVELMPATTTQGGVRVKLADEDVEIDLTDEAIARLLLKHMLPRFRAIMEGSE